MDNRPKYTSPEDIYINKEGKAVDRKSADRHQKLVAAGQEVAKEELIKAGALTEGGTFINPNIPDEEREPRETLIATDAELGKGPKASDNTKLGKAEKEIEKLKKQIADIEAERTESDKKSEEELKKVAAELAEANAEREKLKKLVDEKTETPEANKAVPGPAATKAVNGPEANK